MKTDYKKGDEIIVINKYLNNYNNVVIVKDGFGSSDFYYFEDIKNILKNKK